MIRKSMTEPPSVRLLLQRASNENDVSFGWNRSCGAIVRGDLLIAVYVEPLAPGQVKDGTVDVVEVIDVTSSD